MELKRKEFTYRGKTIEELKKLEVREFAKLLRSRQRRSLLKQFQKVEDFVNRAKKKIGKGKAVRTHQRNLIIVPEMIDMKIGIYTGKGFEQIQVTGEMLGHRFGEFALTRSRVKHSKAGVGATKGSRAKSKK